MKFLFKVWSNYNGFTPSEIPNRLLSGGLLRLGWGRYIEAVEPHTEVWVYFHGRHAFENGVYVKGVVHEVDVDDGTVLLRVRQSSTDTPLTDAQTSARIAQVVAARGLQVFLLPEALDAAPACDIGTSARSCGQRNCGSCPTWRGLPLVRDRNLGSPQRLPATLASFTPAYWVIPPRNFVYMSGRRFKPEHRRTDELFRRFKTGEERLAFPLALAMREVLAERGLDEFDVVVPIPLSPDKEEAGEIHRTRLLACELASLLGSQVREVLTLSAPISKRRLRGGHGYTAAQFENAYQQALLVDDVVRTMQRVLLVDDVCTEGSTIRAATAALRAINSALEVAAVTGGQMTVRAAVENEQDLIG